MSDNTDRVVRIAADSLIDAMYRGRNSQQKDFAKNFVESAMLAIMVVADGFLGNEWVDPTADESWTKKAALPGLEDTFVIPDTITDKQLVDIYDKMGWGRDALGKFISSRLKQQPEMRAELDKIIGGAGGPLPAGGAPAMPGEAPGGPGGLSGKPDKGLANMPSIDKVLSPSGKEPALEQPKPIVPAGPEPVRKSRVSRDSVSDASQIDEFDTDVSKTRGLPGDPRTKRK